MVIIRGVLEMLSLADSYAPKSFNDFTKIVIKGKRLSSATVSKRINQLCDSKVLEEVITKSRAGRRVIGYRTTDKGKRVIEIAKELDTSLKAAKSK